MIFKTCLECDLKALLPLFRIKTEAIGWRGTLDFIGVLKTMMRLLSPVLLIGYSEGYVVARVRVLVHDEDSIIPRLRSIGDEAGAKADIFILAIICI